MEILSLDSPRWGVLRHAFGPAADVPGVLRALEASPAPESNSAAWEQLWERVHHQGTVYDACCATVPHLVRIALATKAQCSWEFLGFPASVEVHRVKDQGPLIPADLEHGYMEAVALLPEVVLRQTKWQWDHIFAQAAAAALVVSRGQVDLAEAILELGPSATKEFFKWWFGDEA